MDPTLSTFLACLICLLPFVAGAFFGGWFSTRLARYGMPGALLPEFVRKFLEGLNE